MVVPNLRNANSSLALQGILVSVPFCLGPELRGICGEIGFVSPLKNSMLSMGLRADKPHIPSNTCNKFQRHIVENMSPEPFANPEFLRSHQISFFMWRVRVRERE